MGIWAAVRSEYQSQNIVSCCIKLNKIPATKMPQVLSASVMNKQGRKLDLLTWLSLYKLLVWSYLHDLMALHCCSYVSVNYIQLYTFTSLLLLFLVFLLLLLLLDLPFFLLSHTDFDDQSVHSQTSPILEGWALCLVWTQVWTKFCLISHWSKRQTFSFFACLIGVKSYTS